MSGHNDVVKFLVDADVLRMKNEGGREPQSGGLWWGEGGATKLEYSFGEMCEFGPPFAYLLRQTGYRYFFRKQSYAGVVFTRFCGQCGFQRFLKRLVVLKNVSSKNVNL